MYYKKSWIINLFTLLLVFNFLNCSTKEERQSNSGNALKVQTVNEDSLKNIIARNKGNVVFINVWATWCEPCVKEFPDIVKISGLYKNKVKFLSLSVDSKSDIDSLVIPFVKKQKADFPVYLVDEKRSEEVINFLNPSWSGAVPVTIIYDKEGKQQKFLSGIQSYSEFKNSIDSVRSLL